MKQREELLERLEDVKVDGIHFTPTNSTALSLTLSGLEIPSTIGEEILSMTRKWYESNLQYLKLEFEKL